MKVLVLASAFDSLTQRAWVEVRRAGHQVTVELATSADAMRTAVHLADPDLVLCPFLTERVPSDIRATRRTILIHPGPVGDRGPTPLDWAILDGVRRWGVTAVQATAEPGAGPVWATQDFDIPGPVVAKAALYDGPVADAAMDVIHEVLGRAADPRFAGVPQDGPGVERPAMRPDARRIDWDADPRETVFRKVAASDGAPGALCDVTALGVLAANEQEADLYAYDAFPADGEAPPGLIGFHRDGAALVGCADGGALWIGQLRRRGGVVLPAARVLGREVRAGRAPDHRLTAEREIRYHRQGPVGWLTFDLYGGAMSTAQCRRLLLAFHHAAAQDTRVLVLRGGDTWFATGLHLGEIEAAARPPVEAWANVEAMDDLCRAIITCVHQLVLVGVSGNADAGGIMMALGADLVACRTGVVLNPYYRTMGLYGSDYWTYTLARRVGADTAAELTTACLPVGDDEALRLGLVDELLARDPARYDEQLRDLAERLAADGWHRAVERKVRRRAADEARLPLEVHRTRELGRMADDLFDDDRHAQLRRAFVMTERPVATPAHLALHRRAHAWLPSPRTPAPDTEVSGREVSGTAVRGTAVGGTDVGDVNTGELNAGRSPA